MADTGLGVYLFFKPEFSSTTGYYNYHLNRDETYASDVCVTDEERKAWGNKDQAIRLPVGPLDSVNIDQSANINQQNLAGYSAVFGGGMGLMSVSFSSVFPMHNNEVWAHPTSGFPVFDPSYYDRVLRFFAKHNIVFQLVISNVGSGGGFTNESVDRSLIVYDRLSMVESYSPSYEEDDSIFYSVTFRQYQPFKSFTVRNALTNPANRPPFHISGSRNVPNRKKPIPVNTYQRIVDYYKPKFKITVAELIKLNPKMKDTKGDLVKRGNQVIKTGTKIRLRTGK